MMNTQVATYSWKRNNNGMNNKGFNDEIFQEFKDDTTILLPRDRGDQGE
jgi:hypothetical protein